jgi:hypothetical protein
LDEINDLKKENDALKERINNLESELYKEEREIYEHLETIENLEDSIIKLESLIPKDGDNKKLKKKEAIHSKLTFELEEKDKKFKR